MAIVCPCMDHLPIHWWQYHQDGMDGHPHIAFKISILENVLPLCAISGYDAGSYMASLGVPYYLRVSCGALKCIFKVWFRAHMFSTIVTFSFL